MKLNLETHSQGDEVVKAYLEGNASEILADKINNGVFIEKDGKRLLNRKSLSTFMKYAAIEAKKLSGKGASSACVKDDVVFGWAIHYFEEDDIEGTLYNEDGSEYKKPVQTPKTSEKSTYTPTSACTVKKSEPQLSLFDMMNNDTKETEEKNIEDSEDDYEEPTDEDLEEAAQATLTEPIKEEKPNEVAQSKGTPFYEKYKELALKYPDGIICCRLGDFYEILGKKAIVAANELELTLTSRDCGLEKRLPMVGFPYHSSEMFIAKLVANGHKVVVAETLNNIKQYPEPEAKQEINVDTGEIISDEKDDNEILNNYHKGALLTLLELFDNEATIG